MSETAVLLSVYDISNGMAKQFGPMFGLSIEGIWHTGLVVYGTEYFYGGGLSYDVPGRTPFGSPLKTISLGTTQVPQPLFHDFLEGIADQYTAYTYDLLKHNCNNFTNDAAMFLVGTGIPQEIISLPDRVMSSPIGHTIRPFLENMQNQLKQYRGQHPIGQDVPAPQIPKPIVSVPTTGKPRFNGLPMTAVAYWRPVLFKTGSSSRIVAKLTELLTGALTTEEEETLKTLTGITEHIDQLANCPLPQNTFSLISKLLKTLVNENAFPLYDFVRLLILHPSILNYLIASEATSISSLMNSLINGTASDSLKLTALRFINNLFSGVEASGPAAFLATHSSLLLQVYNAMLNLPKETKFYNGIREMTTALGYNLSLVIARDDSDDAAELISASLFQIADESNADNVFNLLMTVGHMIYTNDEGVKLVQTFGIDLSMKEVFQDQKKVQNVANDLSLLLK